MINRYHMESILLICAHLNVYLSAGIPILKALELIKLSLEDNKYIQSIETIINDLKAGETFSGAIKRQGNIYPSIFGDMITIGEESGSLEIVLEKLLNHFQQQNKTNKNIGKAVAYPIFLTAVIIIASIVYILFILPNFKTLYDDIKGETGFIMGGIINYLNFITDNKYAYFIIFCYFILTVGLIFLVCDYYWSNGILNKFKLYRMYNETKIIFILDLILNSGVSINYSLEKFSENLESKDLRRYITDIKDNLWRGHSLSEALRKIDIISPITISFIFSGEESGKLDSNVRLLSNILEDNYVNTTIKLVNRIQPILIGILGSVVAVMVMVVFIPIYGYMNYV